MTDRNARTVVALRGGLGYPSATRELTDAVLDTVGHTAWDRDIDVRTHTVEVRDHAHDVTGETLLGMRSTTLEAALTEVEQADALVAASPVFRGSYAGLLKSFVDLIDPVALRGQPVLVAATGGSDRHTPALGTAMRPPFAYFGAPAMPTGLYATGDDYSVGSTPTDRLRTRIERAAHELTQQLAVAPTPVRLQQSEPSGASINLPTHR